MKIPKIECKCGCTSWTFNDGVHECKKCPEKITTTEMLRRVSEAMLKKDGVMKDAS